MWVNGKVYGTLAFASPAVRRKPFGALQIEHVEMLARSLGYLIALRQAAELNAAKAAAEAASAAKAIFLASVSHELLTPPNAILGFSEMIKEQVFGADLPRYVEHAADIHASGQHLLALINDVLDLSKIEADKYELFREPLDPRGLVAGCLRMVAGKAKEAGIALMDAVPADTPSIFADERALRQVLLNLLSNAIKFTPAGGQVRVRATWTSERFVLAVRDTGVGIAAQDLKQLGSRSSR